MSKNPSHSSKTLPGLLEGLKNSLLFILCPIRSSFTFPQGFEIQGDSGQGLGGDLNWRQWKVGYLWMGDYDSSCREADEREEDYTVVTLPLVKLKKENIWNNQWYPNYVHQSTYMGVESSYLRFPWGKNKQTNKQNCPEVYEEHDMSILSS